MFLFLSYSLLDFVLRSAILKILMGGLPGHTTCIKSGRVWGGWGWCLKIIENRVPFTLIRPIKGIRGLLFRALEVDGGGLGAYGASKIKSEFVSIYYVHPLRSPRYM